MVRARPNRLIVALALGTCTMLAIAWALPMAAYRVGGPWGLPGAASPEAWWIDDDPDGRRGWDVPKGGRYFLSRHALLDRVDFRRIIFVGTVRELAYYRRNPPPAWAAVISTDMREGFEQVVTVATGWPLRCFRGEHWVSWRPGPPAPRKVRIGETEVELPGLESDPPTPPPERLRGALRVTPAGRSDALIPWLPMWPGLAADAGVWSAAWLAALIGLRLVRRSVRHRRGRCPACGYRRAGLPPGAPCPECGER